MEIYTIKRGVMRELPEDWTFKQWCKYLFFFMGGFIVAAVALSCQG